METIRTMKSVSKSFRSEKEPIQSAKRQPLGAMKGILQVAGVQGLDEEEGYVPSRLAKHMDHSEMDCAIDHGRPGCKAGG